MAARLIVSLLVISAIVLGGCDEEKKIEQDDSGPIVGLLELPISLRNEKAEPSNPLRIEVSPSELRVDSAKVLDLDRGKLGDKDVSGGIITALAAKIDGGPARRASSIRVHVNVPYGTLVPLLATLKRAHISDLAFEVRKGQSVAAGYLDFGSYEVVEPSDDPVSFDGSAQRKWDEFTDGWEESYSACRRDHYVDCDMKQSNIATGGDVQITLFARGTAAKIELQRFDPDSDGETEAEKKPAQPQMIDGVPPPPEVIQDEGKPVESAAFTWRGAAITDELSPVSGMMRPMCGAKTCGALVVADSGTMSMRVLSLIGAAFPNGTQPPHLKFQKPPK